MLPMENAVQMNAYIHARYSQTTSTGPRAIRPNGINHPHATCPNETVGANIHAQFSQAKYVGAVPVCPPERPCSGVSIPKNTHIVRGEFNDRCALAGRQGRAHRHRPYPSQPTTRGVPLPHHIVHSIAHANHAVCHYLTTLYIR